MSVLGLIKHKATISFYNDFNVIFICNKNFTFDNFLWSEISKMIDK